MLLRTNQGKSHLRTEWGSCLARTLLNSCQWRRRQRSKSPLRISHLKSSPEEYQIPLRRVRGRRPSTHPLRKATMNLKHLDAGMTLVPLLGVTPAAFVEKLTNKITDPGRSVQLSERMGPQSPILRGSWVPFSEAGRSHWNEAQAAPNISCQTARWRTTPRRQ